MFAKSLVSILVLICVIMQMKLINKSTDWLSNVPHRLQYILQSVGNVTWADEDLQINALHFVPKLVILLQLHIICNYVSSTALSGTVFVFKLFSHYFLSVLCHTVCFTGSSCVQQVPDVLR